VAGTDSGAAAVVKETNEKEAEDEIEVPIGFDDLFGSVCEAW
jgi:hypothetical protein